MIHFVASSLDSYLDSTHIYGQNLDNRVQNHSKKMFIILYVV